MGNFEPRIIASELLPNVVDEGDLSPIVLVVVLVLDL
jgi:hypothetical protein